MKSYSKCLLLLLVLSLIHQNMGCDINAVLDCKNLKSPLNLPCEVFKEYASTMLQSHDLKTICSIKTFENICKLCKDASSNLASGNGNSTVAATNATTTAPA